MVFGPDITEQLARARADLRLGVPIVLAGSRPVLVMAAETLTPARLTGLLAMGGEPVLAISARRAETLKARAYDGSFARVLLPRDATLRWVKSIADPADDLRSPLKGPLACARGGDATPHGLAIDLIKSARLLPAAVILDLADAGQFAQQNGLTMINLSGCITHDGGCPRYFVANPVQHTSVHTFNRRGLPVDRVRMNDDTLRKIGIEIHCIQSFSGLTRLAEALDD